jgi:hypothetical protein
MLPTARKDKLTIQQLPDETLVFDHEHSKAHCLNPIASRVWKACDGRTSLAKLARRLELPEAAVGLALEQLDRRHLLQSSVRNLSAEKRRSRRDLLRKIALAALPVIMTITVPRAAQAASQAGPTPPPPPFCQGKPNGTSCGSARQICCNGNCFPFCGCPPASCQLTSECCPGLTCSNGLCS